MRPRPTIGAPPVVLRPFRLDDAARVAVLANDELLSTTLLRVPHPYAPELAVSWIKTHESDFERGATLNLAITLATAGELVGSIGLEFEPAHNRAAMGYWIGREYWGRGLATAAAAGIVRYGFEALGLQRIWAYHYVGNEASGRVMEKIGMTREGFARSFVRKGDVYKDCVLYGIVRTDAVR